jgi:hypothetical protein
MAGHSETLVERRFGRPARLQVKATSDFAFRYYTIYLNARIEHAETLRLGPVGAQRRRHSA